MATSPLPLSLRDAFRILFRQKYRTGLVFLVLLALTAAAIVCTPRRYASEARLYLRLGREDTSLDPVATTGENISVMVERESEIKSAIQILGSVGVLNSVVDAIGAEAILSQDITAKPSPPKDSLRGRLGRMIDRSPITAKEQAVKKLRDWVWVNSEKKSSVISVHCVSGSALLSQRIVQEVIDEYRRRHIMAHRSEGSMDFFASQAERLQSELGDASQQLRDAKNSNGVVSVEVQRNIIQLELDNLNTQIAEAESSLAEARMKLDTLQRNHAELATSQVASTRGVDGNESASGMTSAALDDMRKELYVLQLRDLELGSKYYESHPDRQAIREQVAEGRRILAEQELMMEQSNVATYLSRVDALNRRMFAAMEKLQHLNRSEVEMLKLSEEVARLQRAHAQYTDSYEVSRINQALEAQRITNVRVVQEPTLENKPVSPKKGLLAVLGMLASSLGAMVVAFGSEYIDPTMKTHDEVELQLDLPVLVSIPRLQDHCVSLK